MNALRQWAAEYLAVRRALGYRLEGTQRFLGQFIDYLEAQGAERITVEHALAWVTLPQRGEHWHAMRLGAVRGFARYLHEVDRSVEVPPADVVPDRTRRAVPYLYSDEEILALMAATDSVLRAPHKQARFRTLIGLLVATGMRVGEAIALDRTDFDADTGALVVRRGKFGKSRELPLHPTTTTALNGYLARRDRPRPADATEPLLVTTVGTRMWMPDVQNVWRALRAHAGLVPRSAMCRPRLHDMRHSFAGRTLLDACRTDGDPAGKIASLWTYLGHVNPGKTYWYLQAAPELMQRLKRRFAAV